MIILISWIGHHNLLALMDKLLHNFNYLWVLLLTVIFLPFPAAFMAEFLNTICSLLFYKPGGIFIISAGMLFIGTWLVLSHWQNNTNLDLLKKSSMDPNLVSS
jgi:hypothetical protein